MQHLSFVRLRARTVLVLLVVVLGAVASFAAAMTAKRRQPAQVERRSQADEAPPAVSHAPQPAAAPTAPSITRVLLITIDTLRADQPWSGYDRIQTPSLSALARRSHVFLRAYSVANTTGPSVGAILSSRYPSELQRDDCPLAGMDFEDGLPDQLAASGVWTAAAHGHPYFASSAAPRRGFLVWRNVANAAGRRASEGAITGPDVTDLALELLRSAPPDRPAFLWAHYVDPHDKYVLHPGFPPSSHPSRSHYDGEVAFTDHHVGRLLQAVAASADASSTAILVTSDHGEAFGEHGRWRHGMSVFEEEVRVPLLLFVPGTTPRVTQEPRSTIDVAPTIAALFGQKPHPSWRGRSLLDEDCRPVIVDCPTLMNSAARRAVVIGNHKVIDADGRLTVYDLAADPGERAAFPGGVQDELLERARQAWEAVPYVAPRRCARQAYRVAP